MLQFLYSGYIFGRHLEPSPCLSVQLLHACVCYKLPETLYKVKVLFDDTVLVNIFKVVLHGYQECSSTYIESSRS